MRTLPALLVGLALALPAGAARTPRDYAWLFPLELPAAATNNAWRVELTPAVYAHVHDPTLRDIAVFNADGQLVPMARDTSAPAAVLQAATTTVPLLPLPGKAASGAATDDLHLLVERDAAGRLRRLDLHETGKPVVTGAADARDWLLDASAIDGVLERLELDWDAPASGVVARFELGASDDLQSWRTLGGGTVFALQQGDARLDRHDLALGGIRANYLRLQRSDAGAPLQGLRAQLRYRTRQDGSPPALAWLQLQAAPTEATPASDAAPPGQRFDYALPATLPVERVRIELAGDNTLADVALEAVSRDAATPLARTTAFRLANGADTLRNDDVALTGTVRLGRLRLATHTPLAQTPCVQVAYRPDRFVFLAEGKPPYSLVVGSASARLPDYPLDAALGNLRLRLGPQWQPPLASIGTGVPSGGDSVLKPPPIPISWQRWLLWLTLIAGTALVGVLALGMLRGPRN